jgi:hypothetical protein
MDYNTLPNMDSENCSKDKRVKAVLSPGGTQLYNTYSRANHPFTYSLQVQLQEYQAVENIPPHQPVHLQHSPIQLPQQNHLQNHNCCKN